VAAATLSPPPVVAMGMSDDHGKVANRVLGVLADADEPLSTGRIQRRIANDGLDIATSAIRDACEELDAAGEIETVGESPRQKYRLAD
jgi:repressor of nif and glnA expression